MARRVNNKHRTRNFIILVLVVAISGFALNAAGYLVSPFEYSTMMLNEPPREEMGFAMVTINAESGDIVTEDSDAAAADSEALAEGGEVLSERPEGFPDDGGERMPPDGGGTMTLADYFNFSWHEVGTVLYNLWVMMALTVAVIVIARPIGWIVKRFKRPATRSTTNTMQQVQLAK